MTVAVPANATPVPPQGLLRRSRSLAVLRVPSCPGRCAPPDGAESGVPANTFADGIGNTIAADDTLDAPRLSHLLHRLVVAERDAELPRIHLRP
jgi:hypothetical protein